MPFLPYDHMNCLLTYFHQRVGEQRANALKHQYFLAKCSSQEKIIKILKSNAKDI